MSIWTHELDPHFVQTEDRSQLIKIEQQITHEYNEIKSEIEDNDLRYNLTFTRPFSSYLIPKDPLHFGRERRLYLEHLAHVSTVPNTEFLSDEFENELNTCSALSSDFTSESLPLLLHGFYLKRLSILTYAKSLHSVRWKRFCRQQIQFQQVEQQFNERSSRIHAEFNDTFQRVQRLSSVRENLLSPSTKNVSLPVVNDDYVAYVRYLICHYRGQKMFDQLTDLIRLFHYKFRTRPSTDSQTMTINLQSPISPFQNTTALQRIPTIELEQKDTLEKLNRLFQLYSLPLDTSKIQTSGDEMELYANIVRYYRTIFLEQEKERPSISYDSAKPKILAQSRQSSSCLLIKKASWTEFIILKPEHDAQRERDLWKYIKGGKNDELLMRISQFLHVRNPDKVANILKQYLLALKAKKSAALKQVLESSTTNAGQATAMTDIFWKNIFDLNDDDDNQDNDNDDLPDSFDFRDTSTRSNRYMKRDEFNYLETLQKLGLDDTSGQRRDSDTENNDASESYGLQLSYITLRLLRIRTIRNRCLHEFNYLQSLQRTLTIYEQRLTMSSKGKEFHSVDQRFNHYVPHTYIFDAPHECTLDTLKFMQSEEHIENIEDFAHETNFENDGSIIHVQDSLGLHIIYDSAFDDINKLEQEIIGIGSYFIEKSSIKSSKDNDFQRKIDRFEILYNLWEYELTYLQLKRQLIDCFYEIYQHTFDENERQILNQIILNLIHQRPRIDFQNDEYFSHSYSLEIRFLQQYLALIREYLSRHINTIRQITENLFDSTDYGSFFPSTRSQSSPPIYLSVSKNHSYYLFEFLESLSSLTRLPNLLKQTFNELIEFEQMQQEKNLSLTDKLLYELEYLDDILNYYKQLDQPGAMYSLNHQRDVFNSLFSDHPTMMGKFAYEILKQVDESRTTKKEQYDKYLKLNTNLIELITLRYRLIRSASQAELLTIVYKQQLDTMSIDHSHLYLRYVQFEFAQPRSVEHENDLETSRQADGRLDKITGQQHLLFAIQELEEGSIGRLNFRQKDQWLSLINDGDDASNNLKVALRTQLMHNHFVHTAIIQHRLAIICITQQLHTAKFDTRKEQTKTPPIGKRQLAELKQAEQSNNLLNNALYENARRKLFREHYFISIQFEKSPSRDRILNEFLRQRELKPMQYQQAREAEKLKRTLLNDFIDRLHQRNALILLRLQIIQSYLSLTYLIHQFPLTSKTHFIWAKPAAPPLPSTSAATSLTGDQPESATPSPILTTALTPNGYQYRPKTIVNEQGTDLINLWYIPSFFEQLGLFKNTTTNTKDLEKKLKDFVRIISSLNDLIHIVVAFAQLNSTATNAEQRFNDRAGDLNSFDQSGEFASELHEIQREIDSSSSLSLSTIADLLETKRRLTIYQIYYTISCLIPNCFLSAKNQIAYDLVHSRSIPILHKFISDFTCYKPLYSILPSPFLSVQRLAYDLYPWTVYEHEYNINSRRLWFPKYTINDFIHVSLIGLKPQELALANAEYVSTQVMLQNIDEILKVRTVANHLGTVVRKKEAPTGDHLSKYIRLEIYLTECLRLNIVREAWSTTKLNVHSIDTVKKYIDAFDCFRDEIRSPVLRQLSTAVGYSTFYNDFPLALINGQLAPNVTEYECKLALTMRILTELEGKFMMNDTLKRLKRERTLVLSERLREENSLPTDLWKKQQFTENFSVLRPHILDDLATLLSNYECKDEQSTLLSNTTLLEETLDTDTTLNSSTINRPADIFCIRRNDLELCLKEIGNRLMQRERENFMNYSYYYENLLYNTRQLIGIRENEIKSLRSQLQDQQSSLELDSQLLTLSSYFELITELIRLRSTNAQLQLDKQLRFDKELNRIREKFQSINEQLLNTNLLLRNRFEKYREELYNSTISIIKDIRTEIYNMARAKLTSDARSVTDQHQYEQTKLIHHLQNQLHENQEKQSNDIYQFERQWRREQVELEKTVAHLQYELDHYQKRYVYKTTKQIEEIQALKRANNYLRKRIVTNETFYKRKFENESKSETKANLERDDDLRQALNQKQIIETQLRWMQEQKNQLVTKDAELEKKTTQYERENQDMRLTQTYVKRDLIQTKKKLEQERSLKIDAFQQVQTLRTNLNEIEEELEQMALNDGTTSVLSGSAIPPPPSRTLASSRPITPYQLLLSRNRPMTSISPYQRDKQRLTSSRLRCYSNTPSKRAQTANVHIEKITPLTEEILSNLGASTTPTTSSIKMLRIKSAKT